MQLEISNVGKIENATINIDGITVIAGENNAGKSTIGKLLFAIFNSMNNMNEKIEKERWNKVNRIISMSLQNRNLQRAGSFAERRRKINLLAQKLTDIVMEQGFTEFSEDAEQVLMIQLKESSLFENAEDIEDFMRECEDRAEPVLSISDKKVMSEVITRWFSRVFENQISPLREEGIESRIELMLKGKKITCQFKENVCVDWDSEISILHEAFYIDNPFVIDEMSEFYGDEKITQAHLLKFLCKDRGDIYDGIFDAVMAKDKLNEIYDILEEVIKGDIEENQNGEYYFNSNKFGKPLHIKNLSTGLKSFVLIKRLLENGSLKEKDVLILDEPEIHLHPQWQLLYAKLIVLLQKEFDLSLIITTHSPYFLDAIDVYSAKYGTKQGVHYYLAENEGNCASLRDVTDCIDAIYKKLSEPLQRLENLRYNVE